MRVQLNRIQMVVLGFAAMFVAAVVSVPVTAPTGSADEEATYVGDEKCKKCHFKEHRYWKKTGLYKSLESLKPTTAEDDKELFDRKKAAELDPAKDYSTDATCLACHTTGYGKKGGYPKDVAANKDQAELMGRISCEACHGPGSKYAAHKQAEIEKNKDAKFTFEDMEPMGLIQPNEANCKTCHNDKNPVHATDPFKFDTSKGEVHSKKKKKKK